MSYVSEAADFIHALNANNSILSPHDYLIISEWEKQGIPLELVLISLREYFAEQGSTAEKSIMEIKQGIRNKYAVWLMNGNPMCM